MAVWFVHEDDPHAPSHPHASGPAAVRLALHAFPFSRSTTQRQSFRLMPPSALVSLPGQRVPWSPRFERARSFARTILYLNP